ncbi:MAG: phosphate acyltransferase PlsX [Firmicutes bacterium]|nr:phosphate acyltransferase PlsX [Bacillota bacterium]
MGGDLAPQALVDGALQAAAHYKDVQIILVGQPERLPDAATLPANVVIEPAATVMAMDESVENLRKKRDSSIWIATKMVKEGRADAVISAGSTGAQMAAALLLLGRIPGITRPAICTVFPTVSGGSVLLDIGANLELEVEQYVQFALLGSLAAQTMLQRENPTIGLLNNGTEEHKGTDKLVEVNRRLRESSLNFIGNYEARELMSGNVDVIVTDGFTGNAILKTSEGIARTIMAMLKQELSASATRKMGAMLVKPGLDHIKSMLDYKKYGGAPLLGVNGISVVCHGSSDAVTIECAVKQARDLYESRFVENIREQAAQLLTSGED